MGWIAAGVLACVLVVILVCPWVFMIGLATIDNAFGILPQPSFDVSAEERDLLRDRAADIFDALASSDPDKVFAVWERDGIKVGHPESLDPAFLDLVSGKAVATGMRVENYSSMTWPEGTRDIQAWVIFELRDGSDFRTVLVMRQYGDGYRLRYGPPPRPVEPAD